MTDALRDPAVGFSCFDTPFYPPKTMSISDIPQCESCVLTFAAPVAGIKIASSRYGMDGINIDESPLTELQYNKKKFALFDTVLWKSGAHRNFKAQKNYDLEMNLYFRDVFDPLSQVAIAIPITINDEKKNGYFAELANQDQTKRTFTLESIITSGPVILYKGMDLRNRNENKPYDAPHCHSATASISWFILQPAFISSMDANKIQGFKFQSNVLPPSPSHELTIARVRAMTTTISDIVLKNRVTASSSSADDKGIFLTRALQCQRIDPSRDIKNDAVYLNGLPQGTLQDELDAKEVAADSLMISSNDKGLRPKHIEDILAICAGIAIGIVIFSLFAYFIIQILYKGYLIKENLNKSVMPSVVSAKTLACSSFVNPIVLTGPAPLPSAPY